MEENKHLEPDFSQAFKEMSDILLQNYKDISSIGGESSVFGGQSNISIGIGSMPKHSSGLNNNLKDLAPEFGRKGSVKSLK